VREAAGRRVGDPGPAAPAALRSRPLPPSSASVGLPPPCAALRGLPSIDSERAALVVEDQDDGLISSAPHGEPGFGLSGSRHHLVAPSCIPVVRALRRGAPAGECQGVTGPVVCRGLSGPLGASAVGAGGPVLLAGASPTLPLSQRQITGCGNRTDPKTKRDPGDQTTKGRERSKNKRQRQTSGGEKQARSGEASEGAQGKTRPASGEARQCGEARDAGRTVSGALSGPVPPGPSPSCVSGHSGALRGVWGPLRRSGGRGGPLAGGGITGWAPHWGREGLDPVEGVPGVALDDFLGESRHPCRGRSLNGA
jgi:hypothetical protein